MLRPINDSEFDRIFEIMENSFPTDEYRPYEKQKALLSNPIYKMLVFEENGIIMAFVAVYELCEVVFAEHLAVAKQYRNRGLGAEILKALALEGKGIALEVEPPETDIAKRRIGFYERNGFILNNYPYIQPPISEGKNPVPLFIMTSGKGIGQKEFENLKIEIYKKVYNI